MTQGWVCPRCALVLAPHVTEHRCNLPPGVPAVPVVTGPWNPPGTIGIGPVPGTATTYRGTITIMSSNVEDAS